MIDLDGGDKKITKILIIVLVVILVGTGIYMLMKKSGTCSLFSGTKTQQVDRSSPKLPQALPSFPPGIDRVPIIPQQQQQQQSQWQQQYQQPQPKVPEAMTGSGLSGLYTAYNSGMQSNPNEDVKAILESKYEPRYGNIYNGGDYTDFKQGMNSSTGFQQQQPQQQSKQGSIPVDIPNSETFDALLKSGQPLVVAFTMTGCGHCTHMKPAFMQAASSKPQNAMVIVDTSVCPKVAERYGIQGFPTIIKFKNGSVVEEYKGDRSLNSLLEFASS